MWIQIIDEIFSPLTIKAMAERMNIFQIDLKGRTLESILHGVEVRDIPVKYYHTLFCPIYDLDTHLQSAGGSCAGPTRWETFSRIWEYIGNSPFHASSVSLVWNSTTYRVSPQYHIVFGDDFSTVPYMESGKLPPNWEDIATNSSEMATPKYVGQEDTWFNCQSNVGALYQL